MKPFKLRVDWICHDAYEGEPVVVELHILGEHVRVIHRSDTPVAGVVWARDWLLDRGFKYTCLIDHHQRAGDKWITLFPVPESCHGNG